MTKSAIWIILFSLSFLMSSAQSIKVTGKVRYFSNSVDSLEFNVPFTADYYPSNSEFTKIGPTGEFEFELHAQHRRYVQVIYRKKKQWLLLTPGRDLFLTIDTCSQGHVFTFSGPAKIENDLLARLEPDEGLFFSRRNAKGRVDVPYVYWSVDSIFQNLLPMVKNDFQKDEATIQQSSLPARLRNWLYVDLKYYYAIQFMKLVGTWASKNGIRRYLPLADSAKKLFSLPSEVELQTSQSARYWLSLYAQVDIQIANFSYFYSSDKRAGDSIFKVQVGFSYSYLKDTLMKSFGNTLAADEEAYRMLPRDAAEWWLATCIELQCELSDIAAAKLLMKKLVEIYPNSEFRSHCEAKIRLLDKNQQKYALDTAVHIRPDYHQISSLRDLLSPYKGRVVYIDLWGTWCGHCMDELKFEPQLQDRFKNNDVTFLFVDDDPDNFDDRWRSYISMNDVKGEHVRLTDEQFQKLWQELAPPDHRDVYPTYFIADKEGNLAVRIAKRPSDQSALYAQISDVLSKK